MSEPDVKRHDVMVVLPNPSTKVGEGIAVSLLRYLAISRVIRPVDEALHVDWTEVYCEPGPSAHEPFVKGVYDGPIPVFKECCVRWGTKPAELDLGSQKIPVYFFLEFRGSAYDDPLGPFRSKFKEIMRVPPRIGVQEHTELPPHKMVEPEDVPKDKRLKKKVAGGQAGTSIEEW
jgi:hypothetical protein